MICEDHIDPEAEIVILEDKEIPLFGYVCPHCKKTFPAFYKNKGIGRIVGYWGNGQRYNFRGPVANFNRHVKACSKKE